MLPFLKRMVEKVCIAMDNEASKRKCKKIRIQTQEER
jgi:hypothetical protein